MWILLFAAVPVVACIAVAVRLITKSKNPYVELVPSVSSLIICLALWFGIRSGKTSDCEYWTSFGKEVVYTEGWTEIKIETDSEGRVSFRTVNHPPEWRLKDGSRNSVSIHEDDYLEMAKRWGHTPIRGGWSGRDHSYAWNGDLNTSEVFTSLHLYENRVQASRSVFNFKPFSVEDVKTYGLHKYPQIEKWKCTSMLGDWPYRDEADVLLGRLNAAYGKDKQIRVWLLAYRDQPIEAAILQESFWQGGNKNELVVCVGFTGETVDWSYVFSWTTREDLKIEVRDLANEHGLDPRVLIRKMEPVIAEKWERKQFHDFDYVSIDFPTWGILLGWFLSLAIGVPASLACSAE